MAKVLKALAYLVLGVVVLAVTLVLLLFIVNRNDEPPTAAAQRFEDIVSSRPEVPAVDNAVVYALGFDVPEDMDPVQVGAERMTWIASLSETGQRQGPDPGGERVNFAASSSPEVARLKELCSEDERAACAREFDAIAPAWAPTAGDELALHRYRELLVRRAWRGVIPLDMEAPLPSYGDVIHVQRLYYLQAMQLALVDDQDAVRSMLEADFSHWRAAQLSADGLIAKMIAVSALRHHFFYSALILREVPPQAIARVIPPDWEREFAGEELSLRRVLAGEYAFVKQLFSQTRNGQLPPEHADGDDDAAIRNPQKEWLKARFLELLQVQATANIYADRYARMSEAFAVPIRDYVRTEQSLRHSFQNEEHPWTIYNPMRHFLNKDDGSSMLFYPMRVASLEGMRRGALLIARLHSARVPPSNVASKLAEGMPGNPFTDEPFEWNEDTLSIAIETPGDHRWKRIEYFY